MTTFLMNYYSVLEMLNCQELVVGLIITHVILYYNNILLLLYDINYNITNLNQKVHVKYYYFSKYWKYEKLFHTKIVWLDGGNLEYLNFYFNCYLQEFQYQRNFFMGTVYVW